MTANNNGGENKTTENSNLPDLVHSLFKHKILIVSLFVVSIIIAVPVTLILPKEYVSTATAILTGAKNSNYNSLFNQASELLGMNLFSSGTTINYKAVLESRKIALKVSRKLDLPNKLNKKGEPPLKDEKVFKYLTKNVIIDDSTDSIIRVKAAAPTAKLSADIANEYLAELSSFLADNSSSTATRNRKFVEKRLNNSRGKLKTFEEKRTVFLQENDIFADPTVDMENELNVYSRLIGELKTLQTEYDSQTARRNAMNEKGMTENGGEVSAVQILADPAVVEVRNNMAKKEIDLLNAKLTYQPGNENIKNIQDEINGLKARLGNEIKPIARAYSLSDDIDYVSLNAKLEAYRSIVSNYEARFRKMPSISTEYLRIIRDIELQSKITAMLFAEYEKALITEAQDTQEIQILDYAVPPDTRTRPKRMLIVGISGILSLLAGMFLAFFIDYVERSYSQNAV